MDFSTLHEIAFDVSKNGTDSTLSDLPSVVLEAFIPGYRSISKLILAKFGFDIAIVVSAPLILFGIYNALTYIWSEIQIRFYMYFLSSIHIDDWDDLFYNVMAWITEQQVSKVSRSLKAETKHVSSYDDDDSTKKDEEDAIDALGIFNFGLWAAKLPPQYAPYHGEHWFFWRGRLFFFSRTQRERTFGRDDEFIKLTCVGRSTAPIKALLRDIKQWSTDKEKCMTVIRRPAAKDSKDSSTDWERVSIRPSRPMNTVSLDRVQKAKIVADINEYLHPASPRWYATRGIPYRRGYLFHGPPGTGKTSLSFALAGIFGLDIFCISLMEPTLTEGDLARLFNTLPRRCIVLLEDIDTAGLLRVDHKEDPEKDETNENMFARFRSNATHFANLLEKVSKEDKKDEDSKKRISLSGLLNAIDGVASHEGRVLIMTTNHPEKLDAALIRPGRVDLQVEFTLATREQIRDIFIRMYTLAENETPQTNAPKPTANKAVAKKTLDKLNQQPGDDFYELISKPPTLGVIDPEKLREMANHFAEQLPEQKMSPAEIQGYLLMRKKEPQRALEEVGKWRDAVIEAREKKSKVVEVQ